MSDRFKQNVEDTVRNSVSYWKRVAQHQAIQIDGMRKLLQQRETELKILRMKGENDGVK